MRNGKETVDKNSGPTLRRTQALAYWSSFVAEHYTHLSFLRGWRARVENSLLEQGFSRRPVTEIPRLNINQITPEEFRREYVANNTPVVLAGFASHWPAVLKWSPEFFAAKYGDEPLCVRTRAKGIGPESIQTRDITMSLLVENIRANGEFYGANLEDLFNNHPELRADLLISQLEYYSRKSPRVRPSTRKRGWRIPDLGEVLSTQIFISNSNGRSGYHCAIGGNFFVQVHGQKKWTFVAPRHSAFMYPEIRKDFLYSSSPVDARMTDDERGAFGYELYNVIPKCETVLNAGDLLYSPQWWWHTVDNLSISIGVALRFQTDGLFAGNSLYTAMTAVSPRFIRNFFQVLRTGWCADKTMARVIFNPEPSSNRQTDKDDAKDRKVTATSTR